MLTLHPRPHDDAEPGPSFPWDAPHAVPEDRAVGLELELIELVRRREQISELDAGSDRALALDAEIAEVLAELADVSAEIPAA